jgi:hypothetical protein
MTRSKRTGSRRRPRDPAITAWGFTCFRIVDGDLIELMHSTNTMFAFVRARR